MEGVPDDEFFLYCQVCVYIVHVQRHRKNKDSKILSTHHSQTCLKWWPVGTVEFHWRSLRVQYILSLYFSYLYLLATSSFVTYYQSWRRNEDKHGRRRNENEHTQRRSENEYTWLVYDIEDADK